MKKVYDSPSMSVMDLSNEQMIALSGVTSVNDNVDIGYGGVDSEGAFEADVKADVFDFEWE